MRIRQFLSRCFASMAPAMILALLPLASRPAAAADVGVRGGAYTDEEQPFLGAEVLFGMSETPRWYGNPNVEHVFRDAGDLTAFSFDMHYDFPSGQPYTFWAGGGPTIIHRDQNGPGTEDTTDPGLNVLLGMGATKGEVRPYGQLKVVVADDSEASIGVGVRF